MEAHGGFVGPPVLEKKEDDPLSDTLLLLPGRGMEASIDSGSKCNKRPTRCLLFSFLCLCLPLCKLFCMEEIGLTGDTISINIAQGFRHFLSTLFCCKLASRFQARGNGD